MLLENTEMVFTSTSVTSFHICVHDYMSRSISYIIYSSMSFSFSLQLII